MKALLRTRAVQTLLGWAIAAYIELVIATQRWEVLNGEAARSALDGPDGLIALFWHGRIVSAIACRPFLKSKPRRVMISHSRDGAFIAVATDRLGIPSIRGSTSRRGVADKGGAAALRQALTALERGEVMIVTPDGPRGPNEEMPVGPILLARASQSPTFLMGLAARPALRLKGWDKARIPLPFSRAVLVLDGPLPPPAPTDGDPEPTRLEWRRRLNNAQAAAEAHLHRRGR